MSTNSTAPEVDDNSSTKVLLPKLVRPHRKAFFQWIPTDDAQLSHTEDLMLLPVKPSIRSANHAGINSITSLLTRNQRAHIDLLRSRASTGAACSIHVKHVVLVHGFGGGLAMWMPNIQGLLTEADAPHHFSQYKAEILIVHAIDMPGFGRSRIDGSKSFKNEQESIAWLTDSIDAWYNTMRLEDCEKWLELADNDQDRSGTDDSAPVSKLQLHHSITMCGHSFGAFTSANYAMRYPHRAKHIVLVDPWGVPPQPPEAERGELPWKFRLALKLFYIGRPFTVIRAAGPFGPKLIPSVRKDFADRWRPIVGDPQIFYDYVYHCNAHSSSTGELAFQACCEGRVFSRAPLLTTLPDGLDPSIELSVMYGSHTWMDRAAGQQTIDAAKASRSSKPASIHTAPINDRIIISGAGHQVPSDNVEEFNQQLLHLLKHNVEHAQQRR